MGINVGMHISKLHIRRIYSSNILNSIYIIYKTVFIIYFNTYMKTTDFLLLN